MDIDELILTAIEPIQSNVWASDLPDNPTFPAIVYDIESVAEETWVQGGGYDQHTVTVYFFSESRVALKEMVKAVHDALMLLPQYLNSGESGDGDFEDIPEVFSYYATHVLRTPNF